MTMTGSQEPRYRVEPARIATDGADAAALMRAYAYPLDLWQQSVVDCWLGRDAYGYSCTTAGLSVPRQNGKNVCLEALELYGLAAAGERILHTAHQVRTSKKAFRRLEAIFTNKRFPELVAAVKTIRYTNGEEAIELDNGGSIEFLARSRQAARGFDSVSRVVFDEAQELTDDQLESILATLSASNTGTRQLILAGTPPYPGCPGTVFRRLRQAILADHGKHNAWHEWSAEGKTVGDVPIWDRALWYRVNPAMGARLTESFTEEEMRNMSADGFARERLGWWSPILTEERATVIPAELWDGCRSDAPKPEGKTAYAAVFAPDGSEMALCGAVIPAEGPARISLIDRQNAAMGVQWLADWLCQRYDKACCVVIDGKGGADVLIDRIRPTWRNKQSVIKPGSAGVVAAASLLLTALQEKTVTWYGPQEALRDSALTATRRPIGGGWGFGGDDPLPIAAASLALWGAKTSTRDPGRKMRIG